MNPMGLRSRRFLQIFGSLTGLVGACLWGLSAATPIRAPTIDSIGAGPWLDALNHSVRLNKWAAGCTAISVLFNAGQEFMRRPTEQGETAPNPPDRPISK